MRSDKYKNLKIKEFRLACLKLNFTLQNSPLYNKNINTKDIDYELIVNQEIKEGLLSYVKPTERINSQQHQKENNDS